MLIQFLSKSLSKFTWKMYYLLNCNLLSPNEDNGSFASKKYKEIKLFFHILSHTLSHTSTHTLSQTPTHTHSHTLIFCLL